MSDCPACGCEHAIFRLKVVNGFSIRKCHQCSLEFCAPMPAAEEIAVCYKSFYDHVSSLETMRLNARRNLDYLAEKWGMRQTAKALDYGCGENVFAIVANGAFFRVFGFDPIRPPPGPFTVNSIVGKWDWITLWGVLEHLTDPLGTLAGLRAELAPGGRIALTTVSMETGIPYQHIPPIHALYFTRTAIEALAGRAGFKVLEYRNYEMEIDSDMYLSILLRTVPEPYRLQIFHTLPDYVEVPTNEVFVVLERDDL